MAIQKTAHESAMSATVDKLQRHFTTKIEVVQTAVAEVVDRVEKLDHSHVTLLKRMEEFERNRAAALMANTKAAEEVQKKISIAIKPTITLEMGHGCRCACAR